MKHSKEHIGSAIPPDEVELLIQGTDIPQAILDSQIRHEALSAAEELSARVARLEDERLALIEENTALKDQNSRLRNTMSRAFDIGKVLGKRLKIVREDSRTDFLTGLSNKGEAYRQLPEMLERLRRENTHKLAIISVDIDHFKKVNDTYGHDVGDKVLQHVANILSRHARRYDLVARNGGEEFLIAISAHNEIPALRKAGDIRREIQNTPCQIDPRTTINVTASLGVTLLDPGATHTYDDAIKLSDEALYAAKNTGRNRVCFIPMRQTANHPTSMPGKPQPQDLIN